MQCGTYITSSSRPHHVAFKISLNIGHMAPRLSLDLGHVAFMLGINPGNIEAKARPKPCPITPRLGVDTRHAKCHLKLSLNLSHVTPRPCG
jgi:hypothetical protein